MCKWMYICASLLLLKRKGNQALSVPGFLLKSPHACLELAPAKGNRVFWPHAMREPFRIATRHVASRRPQCPGFSCDSLIAYAVTLNPLVSCLSGAMLLDLPHFYGCDLAHL